MDTKEMIRNSLSNERDFLLRVQSVVWGRMLFLTQEGRPGIGPGSCQVGDLVVVLYGCSVPVVLRWHEDVSHFSLVGECYIHGSMNGEAAVSKECGKLFKIR
jgi:hypothetical protein